MENQEQEAGTEVLEQPAGASESATEGNEGSQEQQGQEAAGQPGKVEIPPETQKRINAAIGRQHQKFQTEHERAEALQAENERLRGQLPQEQRPEIPPLPDPMDENFDQTMQARDEAVRKATEFDVNQRLAADQAQNEANRQVREQQDNYVKTATAYTARAQKLGVDPTALQAAGQVVAAYGLPDALTQHLLVHEKGPLITQYLAANLTELETLRQLDPISAGTRIATEIVPKIPTAPVEPGAPPPPDEPGGSGAPPRTRGPDGCTYE